VKKSRPIQHKAKHH